MIIKVIGIGLLTVIMSLVFKKEKPEISSLIVVCGGLIVSVFILEELGEIIQMFLDVANENTVLKNFIKPIFKVLSIGYLTEVASGVCEDSGIKSLAVKITLFGKVLMVSVCLPLIKTMFEMLMSLL